MINVQYIVDNGLCDGCCECISACSLNNINILMNLTAGHPEPFINEETCICCGECISICKQKDFLIQQTA